MKKGAIAILIIAVLAMTIIVGLLINSESTNKNDDSIGTSSSVVEETAHETEIQNKSNRDIAEIEDTSTGSSAVTEETSGEEETDIPSEEAILEHEGELEIIVPDGEETFGE